ncbi:MAG: glycosyltransferase, partial [Paludibacter sp.]|nr:glycosyltransferase [Paludibacter sp.]
MNKRIIISVSNDLATDQRVWKVANSLSRNGYEVHLTGRRLKNSFPLTSSIAHKRLRLLFNKGFLFYVELNIRLFLLLLFSSADIFYANDTDTLPACFLAAKIKNIKLIFDAHELFPEVPELQNRPLVKKVWKIIEDIFFPHLTTAFTVCQSIADYYNQKYHINMKVIKNVPYLHDPNEKKIIIPGKKIILYQGAVNIGRGLEWVIDAMPYIDNAILYIVGSGDILTQ